MNAKKAKRKRKLVKIIYQVNFDAWQARRPKWWQFWKLAEWKRSKPKKEEFERKYKNAFN